MDDRASVAGADGRASVAGAEFFLLMLTFDRAALETEPGDVGAFKH
ncbi:hypothetical protein ACFWJW_15600 [Streptomyces sp. NPDC127097]